MQIRARSHNPHEAKEITIALPDDYYELSGALWGIATYEILRAIEARLRGYSYADYRHVRDGVSVAVSGSFIREALKTLAAAGTITLDDRGRVTAVAAGWRDGVLG